MSDKGYSYKSSGTNSQGNHYCARDHGNGSHSYHYSNTNGSYYSNPNGSTYYNNGSGGSTYTSPSGNSTSQGYGWLQLFGFLGFLGQEVGGSLWGSDCSPEWTGG